MVLDETPRTTWGRIAVLLSLMSAGTGSATAGAWTLPEGKGLAIATVSTANAEARFDDRRDRVSTSRFRKNEAYVLVEYGLTDRVTLKGRMEAQSLSFDDRPQDDWSGLGFTDFGGRLKLVERGSFVGSVEGTARVAPASAVPGIGDERRYASEYEARLLAGYGFTVAGWQSFAGAETAYRVRDGFGPDEVRFDATLGTRPRDDILLLLQSFSILALDRPEVATIGFDQHKLQASGVYDLTEALSVQAGAFSTVAGRNTLQEDGLFASVWYRF